MIKHTSCQEIHIKLVTHAKDLRLTIVNTHKEYKNQTEQEGGRGLERIQKRLAVFKGLLNRTEMAYLQEAEIVFPFQ
jgi:nitrate/nitrite-specific signal transduction histidine kinase